MLAEVFGVDGVFFMLVVLAPLALAIYCTVDVARQPALTSGQKTAWIIGFLAGWFLFELVGLILALVYLAAIRPKLMR
ncbi:MAG TPA: hypothetical protein VEJ87_07410 [Acidimicrobiales bacterium]|nr:hypothetical protein [Acidimicrobiales bacterium]